MEDKKTIINEILPFIAKTSAPIGIGIGSSTGAIEFTNSIFGLIIKALTIVSLYYTIRYTRRRIKKTPQ